MDSQNVEVELVAMEDKIMRKRLDEWLNNLKENKLRRLPDGRNLTIYQAAWIITRSSMRVGVQYDEINSSVLIYF